MAISKLNQEEFYKLLGTNIRARRVEANLKQESLAQELGVSRIYISYIESGKHKIQLHSLLQLCNYLNTPLEEIVPVLSYSDTPIPKSVQKGLNKAEIASSKNAVDKVKRFINFSENS